MNQIDNAVEMLSEKRAVSKLKHISIIHGKESSPFPSLSEIRFIVECERKEEHVITVWGENLHVGFGIVEIKLD